MLQVANASYMMHFYGFKFDGIADIFPQTSQITSEILPWSLAYNLYKESSSN